MAVDSSVLLLSYFITTGALGSPSLLQPLPPYCIKIVSLNMTIILIITHIFTTSTMLQIPTAKPTLVAKSMPPTVVPTTGPTPLMGHPTLHPTAAPTMMPSRQQQNAIAGTLGFSLVPCFVNFSFRMVCWWLIGVIDTNIACTHAYILTLQSLDAYTSIH